jgi:hypothetical protein
VAVHGNPGAEALPGEMSHGIDWCRRGTAGGTDLLPSTYQTTPCRMDVELLLAIIVDIVSNAAPHLRSLLSSWQ